MFPLYLILFIDDHVVTQVVKSQFVVGTVRNITVICRTTLVVGQTVENTADSQAQIPQYLAHFVRLCLCQIVVDCNNVYALACQCIQICSHTGYQCFTFTGFHLGDTSLMQDNGTDDLYRKRFFAQNTVCSFPHGCQCFCLHAFQRFAVLQTFPKFIGLFFQICIRKCLILLVQLQNLFFQRFNTCQFTGTVRTEYFTKNAH